VRHASVVQALAMLLELALAQPPKR
jgi:hypothetical protein